MVDIAGIRGKLLASPWGRRGTRTAAKGLPRSSGWTGGWAWKGPGHPVDNGTEPVADGTDSGPKALPGSFPGPARRWLRHESEGRFVVFPRGALCGRRGRRSEAGAGISWPALSVTNLRD